MSNVSQTTQDKSTEKPASKVREKLHVLHIDDSEDFLFMFRMRYRDYYDIESLDNPDYELSVKPLLLSREFDAIVLDYEMPLTNGLELLKEIKRDFPNLPVIFYTGQGNEGVAREAFISGASDYFVKNIQEFAHKEKLLNSINRSVEKRKADEELKKLYEQMEVQVKERTAELTRANETLLQKQKQQQALLDSIPDVAWLKDVQGRFVGVNQTFANLTGFTTDEMIGKNIFDVFPEDYARRYHEGDLEVIDSRKVQRFDEPLKTINGTILWVETIKVPIIDNAGEVVGTAGVARDITERLQAEKAVLDAKNFLDKIINSIADPVFVKDREHRWILLNDAFCSFMGYPREELIGKSDGEFFPPQEAEVFWQKDEVVFETGIENENEEKFTDAEGVTHTIVTKKSLYYDSSGEKYIVGVIRDITERIHTEELLRKSHAELEKLIAERTGELQNTNKELQDEIAERIQAEKSALEAEQFLNSIINNIADPIFVKDREHCWILVNNAYCQLVGRIREDLLGKSDYDFFDAQEAEEFWKYDELVFNTGQENINLEKFTDSLGKLHYISTRKTLYIDSAGKKYITGVIRDMTDITVLQRELTEKNRDLNDFIYLLTHDLRSPANNILNYCLLSQQKPEMTATALDKISRQAQNIINLISNLLELSKSGRIIGEPVPLNPEEIIRNVYGTLITPDICSNLRFIKPLPRISGDLIGLEKVFSNLLENALLYRDTDKECLEIEIDHTIKNDMIEISIKDNGSGLAVGDLDKIFSPGFTLRKNSGTGFGLSITRRIIEAHNGSIRVKSPGEKMGTTFLIELPYKPL